MKELSSLFRPRFKNAQNEHLTVIFAENKRIDVPKLTQQSNNQIRDDKKNRITLSSVFATDMIHQNMMTK